MTVAPILEAGELKGSRGEGQEYTTPGVDGCPEGQHTPFDYGCRAYTTDPNGDQRAEVDKWATPFTQFIFRGEETVAGRRHNITGGKLAEKSMGSDQQRIYDEEMVNWTEMDVYVGIPIRTNSYYSVMMHAPYDDGTRQCTRLRHHVAPTVIQNCWLPEDLKTHP